MQAYSDQAHCYSNGQDSQATSAARPSLPLPRILSPFFSHTIIKKKKGADNGAASPASPGQQTGGVQRWPAAHGPPQLGSKPSLPPLGEGAGEIGGNLVGEDWGNDGGGGVGGGGGLQNQPLGSSIRGMAHATPISRRNSTSLESDRATEEEEEERKERTPPNMVSAGVHGACGLVAVAV